MLVGVLAGTIPFFACTKIKNMFGYDDALDTFGVHGVGGTLGALLTGLFATSTVNANLDVNLKGIVGRTLWIEQLKAIAFTLVLATVATAVIAYAVKALVGLRPAPEDEEEGLDLTEHGEPGYHHE
jgi:Amt family ammonium transporter